MATGNLAGVPRVAPNNDLLFNEYKIPKGVGLVSQSRKIYLTR